LVRLYLLHQVAFCCCAILSDAHFLTAVLKAYSTLSPFLEEVATKSKP